MFLGILYGYFSLGIVVLLISVYVLHHELKKNTMKETDEAKRYWNNIKDSYNEAGAFGQFLLTGVLLFILTLFVAYFLFCWPYVVYSWFKGE